MIRTCYGGTDSHYDRWSTLETLLMGDGMSILSHGKDRLRELVASFRS